MTTAGAELDGGPLYTCDRCGDGHVLAADVHFVRLRARDEPADSSDQYTVCGACTGVLLIWLCSPPRSSTTGGTPS